MVKAQIGPFLHSFLFLTILALTLCVASSLVIGESAEGAETDGSAVTFVKVGKNSWSGSEETEFVFTATISSIGSPDHPVELVVEHQGYRMREINPDDTNFSDGKEYQYIGTFDGGPKFYYFRCGNVTSAVSTFNVKESHFFEEYHPDLLAAIGIFVIPLIYALVLLNRLKRHTIVISQNVKRQISAPTTNVHDPDPPANRILGLFILPLLLFFTLIIVSSASPGVEGAAVQFSHIGVQPGSGTEDTPFLFTVKVTTSEEPSSRIIVVINDEEHEMKEMIPDDSNFSDGKDYYHRQRLDKGGVVYYFKSGNATTSSRMFSVTETNRIQYHYDVALVTGIMIVPVLIGIITFRRIEQEFKEMADSLSGFTATVPGTRPEGEEIDPKGKENDLKGKENDPEGEHEEDHRGSA